MVVVLVKDGKAKFYLNYVGCKVYRVAYVVGLEKAVLSELCGM